MAWGGIGGMSRASEPWEELTACRALCLAPSSWNPSDPRLRAVFLRSRPPSTFILFEIPLSKRDITINEEEKHRGKQGLQPILGCPSLGAQPWPDDHGILPARMLEICPLRRGH